MKKEMPVNKAVKLDIYGEGFRFSLPGGQKNLKSYTGCIITLVSLLLVTFYSAVQLVKLLEFEDASIMVSTRDAYFDTDY